MAKDYYLVHHGISGMKWGIRRYQNDDGSLTTEGRARYGYDGGIRVKKNETKAERKSRINNQATAIKNSKVSNREKAKVLSRMGKHQDSSNYYRKDFANKRRAIVLGELGFAAGKYYVSRYLASQVLNGKMSYQQGENVSKAIGIGKNVVASYLYASAADSARKGSKEYWKYDE